jgi:hypothetical protein
MEEGFILEKSETNYTPSIWVAGRPESSFWTVTKVMEKRKLAIATYRCVGCGYLESYAETEWRGRIKPA